MRTLVEIDGIVVQGAARVLSGYREVGVGGDYRGVPTGLPVLRGLRNELRAGRSVVFGIYLQNDPVARKRKARGFIAG